LLKLLLVIVIAYLAYRLLRSYVRSVESRHEPPGMRPHEPEVMVRCSVCGVHLPKSEALTAGGKRYCSEEHRRQGT
jgi:uncharacterized protein